MDDSSTSSYSSYSSKEEGLEDQLTLIRQILQIKKELTRIRSERHAATVVHDETCRNAQLHLSYLKTRFDKQLKHAQPMSVYKRALAVQVVQDDEDGDNHDDNNDNTKMNMVLGIKTTKIRTIRPPTTVRYVVDIQAKLLRNFHWTEIYRNQWEMASNHMIDTTRFFMYEQDCLKRKTRRYQTALLELTGRQHSSFSKLVDHETSGAALDATKMMDDSSSSTFTGGNRSKQGQHRNRSLDMLQQTFTSTMKTLQQATVTTLNNVVLGAPSTLDPPIFMQKAKQHQQQQHASPLLNATVAF